MVGFGTPTAGCAKCSASAGENFWPSPFSISPTRTISPHRFILRKRIFSDAVRPAPIEKRYIDKDGEIVWANLTISWVRKKDGSPDYWISSIEDITERKRVESQLAVVIGRLSEAQRLAGLGHWSRDIKTGMRFWSEEMFRAWGRDPSLGAPSEEENPGQYLTPDSFEKLAPLLARCRSEGEAYECDIEIVRPAGDLCWVTLRGAGSGTKPAR